MSIKKVLFSIIASGALILSACANETASNEVVAEGEQNTDTIGKVTLGSQAADADVWNYIQDSGLAEEAGLEIEVVDIDDGVQLNNATVEGEVEANAYQSVDYMNSFNEESDSELVVLATTYMEPMGIYSQQHASVEDIPEGGVIALADNPANTSRGLRLLEDAGLITLSEDFNILSGLDAIVENPKNLEFNLIDDRTGPRILPDVDAALIGNTQALEGGLNVNEDAIYKETPGEDNKGNFNILAAPAENASQEKLQKLGDLYHSEEVQAYIDEEFGGTKIPVEYDPKELTN